MVCRAPDNFLLQRVFTPWFWYQRVFCFLENVERVSRKSLIFFFRNTKKCHYPVNKICYFIASCLTFETDLFFLLRNILDIVCLKIRMVAQSAYCLHHKCNQIVIRIMGFSSIKYRGLMSGVGTWEFSPKCYACDIGLHLHSFSLAIVTSSITEICHRRDGKHINNEWIRCPTFRYQSEQTPRLTSLKGRCSE
jgi:hypothetical protein